VAGNEARGAVVERLEGTEEERRDERRRDERSREKEDRKARKREKKQRKKEKKREKKARKEKKRKHGRDERHGRRRRGSSEEDSDSSDSFKAPDRRRRSISPARRSGDEAVTRDRISHKEAADLENALAALAEPAPDAVEPQFQEKKLGAHEGTALILDDVPRSSKRQRVSSPDRG
jgi:hypothetical protein